MPICALQQLLGGIESLRQACELSAAAASVLVTWMVVRATQKF